VVEDGQPVGGVRRIEVDEGDRIAFSVRSDVADEVHVHGFDFHKDVPAGGSVRFSFPATITGVFEVELEAAKVQLASLTVNP
jgi:heme/copper-type cytochrome/quinol oxidase subunit 2